MTKPGPACRTTYVERVDYESRSPNRQSVCSMSGMFRLEGKIDLPSVNLGL